MMCRRDRPTWFGPFPILPRTLVASTTSSAASECLADHHLGLAGGVYVCRIDEVDPAVERAVDDAVDGFLIEAADHLPDLSRAAERHAPRHSSETKTPVSASCRYFMAVV